MVGYRFGKESIFAKDYITDQTRIKQPKLNLVTVGRDSSFPCTLVRSSGRATTAR